MSLINHENNFATNVTSNQSAGVTTTPLNSIPSISAPFYIALDATNVNSHYEVVKVTSKTATNINHAATSYAHSTDEEVRLVIPATEMDNLWNATTNAPRGYLLNGKISVTDTAGITVSLKTLAGNDPSATDPVYVRIGDTPREITSALSRSLADGTNWFNAGSAELATKEVDYFAYLVWDSNSSAVGLSFARIPSANLISDFSATTTNEKYCAGYSDFTTTDEVEVIGRFAATLSAGAGYTWSVPTYTAANLIQRPIYETRELTWVPTIVGFSANPTNTSYVYKVVSNRVEIRISQGAAGTSNSASFTMTAPFTSENTSNKTYAGIGRATDNGTDKVGTILIASNSNSILPLNAASSAWTATGSKRFIEGQVVYCI